MKRLLLISAILSQGVSLYSQQISFKQDPVQRWIKDLNSDDLEIRETAAENLIQNFEKAQGALLEVKNNLKDVEIQARLNQILKEGPKNPVLRVLDRKLSSLCKKNYPDHSKIAVLSQDETEMYRLLRDIDNLYAWRNVGADKMETQDAKLLLKAAAFNLNQWKVNFTSLKFDTKFALLKSLHDDTEDKDWGHEAVPLIQDRVYELFKDDDRIVRHKALLVLASHSQHPKVLETARAFLKDREEITRAMGIEALRLRKSVEDAPAVLKMARERLPHQVSIEYWSLDYIRDVLSKDNAEAVKIVFSELDSGDPGARRKAVEILSQWGIEKK